MCRQFAAGLLAGLVVVFAVIGTTLAGQRHIALPEDVPRGLVEMLLLETQFRSVTISRWSPEERHLELFYGGSDGVIRLVRYTEDQIDRRWTSQPLDGRVREIFVEDLDRDGIDELVAYTSRRVYVWSWVGGRSRTLWESLDRDFKSVQAMTIASVDADPALELILAADNRLAYYDGVTFMRERLAHGVRVDPTILLTGNVDRDDPIEIITNDGYVFGVRTLTVEWTTRGFGDPIYLFDVNRDRILDVIGEQQGAAKAWSVADRRQLW